MAHIYNLNSEETSAENDFVLCTRIQYDRAVVCHRLTPSELDPSRLSAAVLVRGVDAGGLGGFAGN